MVLSRLLIVLSVVCISTCVANVLSSTKVSASIKDTVVNGIDGLNINLEAPFKVQDYVVGFKYALGNLKRLPESIFARKSFDTPVDGRLSVDADYFIAENQARISTSWLSDTLGLGLGISGNSRDLVTHVDAHKTSVFAGTLLFVRGTYDLARKSFGGVVSCDIDRTTVTVSGDSESLDPVVTISRPLDAQNEVTPAISLKTGKMSYAWRRRWNGGSLWARIHPNSVDKRLEVEWSDVGTNGVWTTRAEMPLEDSSKVKISISRDWKQ